MEIEIEFLFREQAKLASSKDEEMCIIELCNRFDYWD